MAIKIFSANVRVIFFSSSVLVLTGTRLLVSANEQKNKEAAK